MANFTRKFSDVIIHLGNLCNFRVAIAQLKSKLPVIQGKKLGNL